MQSSLGIVKLGPWEEELDLSSKKILSRLSLHVWRVNDSSDRVKGKGFNSWEMLFGRWRLFWGFFVGAANLMKLWI
jgi:hypothetical protein